MFKPYNPPVFKKLKDMEARVEAALRPIKEVKVVYEKNNQHPDVINSHISKIESIKSSIKKISKFSKPSPILLLEDYLESYNYVKDLVNNFEKYEFETHARREMAKFRQEYGHMPDINSMVLSLNAKQKEAFKIIIHEAAKEGSIEGVQESKIDGSSSDQIAGKFIFAYEMYKDIPQLIDATEKYYVAVKIIVKLFGI